MMWRDCIKGCLSFSRVLGAKKTIIIGLCFEMLQLLWYGFGNQTWMMWAAGILAALASITYPAISAFVSIHSTADRQGEGYLLIYLLMESNLL